jgi:hypothetical protein
MESKGIVGSEEVKSCRECGRQLLLGDRYCRRCGLPQLIDGESMPSVAQGIETRITGGLDPIDENRSYATNALPAPILNERVYRSVSGPLVEALMEKVSSNVSGPLYSKSARKVTLAMVSIMIWLMIILLSPLDVYIATRMMSRGL